MAALRELQLGVEPVTHNRTAGQEDVLRSVLKRLHQADRAAAAWVLGHLGFSWSRQKSCRELVGTVGSPSSFLLPAFAPDPEANKERTERNRADKWKSKQLPPLGTPSPRQCHPSAVQRCQGGKRQLGRV